MPPYQSIVTKVGVLANLLYNLRFLVKNSKATHPSFINNLGVPNSMTALGITLGFQTNPFSW